MLDGAVSIEDVLNRIIGTKDKNYNSYWHAFDEYYDETQKDVEYPKEKNKEESEIVNKKFEREADFDEEDDDDETQKDVEYPMMKRTTRRSSKKMKIDLHCRITMKTTMKRVLC